MKQILIIDDDEKLGELLTQYLARYEMQAHVAMTPSRGFEMIKKLKPDLLILDVMLPEKDGFEVCREIRAKSSIYGQLPILMLTAHAEVTDRIVGLELGADDYLPKPFNPRELSARLKAMLRRVRYDSTPTQSSEKITFGDILIDQASRQAFVHGSLLLLTQVEYDLLLELIQHKGVVLKKEHLYESILNREFSLYDRALDVHISNLRKKFHETGLSTNPIRTVRGVGYLISSTPEGDS